jgi:hypothetical protein
MKKRIAATVTIGCLAGWLLSVAGFYVWLMYMPDTTV